MKKFIVKGGRGLSGEVAVSGSKNAALPLIFSTLALPGESVIKNVPKIGDVEVSLEIIESFGAVVERCGSIVRINTENISYVRPRDELTRKIRASTYLLGACIARFGVAEISDFGGCSFDLRPIDMHLSAFRAFGALIDGKNISASSKRAADIIFDKISVGASINAIIVASSIEQTTRIFGYAKEPHVMLLVEFLRTAGVLIDVFDDRLEIKGKAVRGGSVEVIPDMIEAGTFVSLAIVCDSKLSIKGIEASEVQAFCDALLSSGVEIDKGNSSLEVRGRPRVPISVHTAPHPGFPTDLQPIIAPVLAFSRGGIISETVWKNRFSYLAELSRFGVKSQILGERALIYPSKAVSASCVAPDLRGGAALLLSALAASGESVISSAETVLRGYENICEKLRGVGADIYID